MILEGDLDHAIAAGSFRLVPVPGTELCEETQPTRVSPCCPFCGLLTHARPCSTQRLAMLLSAHAAAWWRTTEAPDFVERVNETYEAYMAGGGTDEHHTANWEAFSDVAQAARWEEKRHAR